MVLNLASLENSDISFKISQFPDGQQNIVIDPDFNKSKPLELFNESIYEKAIKLQSYNIIPYSNIQVQICSRFNNFRDLELIICAVASLRRLGVRDISLYAPYMLGGRSDIDFTDSQGGNAYLVDVIAPIINSLNFTSVVVWDPHSTVMGACIKNLRAAHTGDFYDWVIETIGSNHYLLVCPDAGFEKKMTKIAKQLRYKSEIITCTKERNLETGQILRTHVPIDPFVFPLSGYNTRDYIIFDDICDGGRTFIEIAKVLKAKGVTGKIYLVITHGIFSAGYEELNKYFDGIYCTNSVKDVGDFSSNDVVKTNVKQFSLYY